MSSVDVIQELRAARPTASDVLRLQVESLAETTAAGRTTTPRGWFSRRRLLVAMPLAASLALAAAAGIGLNDGWRSAPLQTATADFRQGERTAEPTELPTNAYGQPLVGSDGGAETGATADQAAAQSKAGAAAGGAAPDATPGRAQRYSASLTIQVADTDALAAATKRAQDTARTLGGYIVSVQYATGTEGTASLTLKVPTAKVQEAIGQLTGLGKILGQQVQIDDLQVPLDQTVQRIESLVGQITALTTRLQDGSLDDPTRLTLQSRRSRLQAELRSLRQSRAAINSEARYATLQLQLVTDQESIVTPAVPSRFDRALDRTVDILAWEALAVLYVAVIAAPIAIVLAALWFGRRTVRRRSDDELLASN